MSILPQFLLAFVGSDLMPLLLLTTGHRRLLNIVPRLLLSSDVDG